MKKTISILLAALTLGSIFCGSATASDGILPTDRGAVVETDRLQLEFRDGILISLHNKLTNEEYLDVNADLARTLPHVPSGLGTQNGEPARAAAQKLYEKPWWEHPNDLALPNQRYPDAKSKFVFQGGEAGRVELRYEDLTDGKTRYPDEVFLLAIEIDPATKDVLVTPGGQSPRPGIYAANLTLSPLAPAISAEAPITDGIRITKENTGPVLWNAQWASYWQYPFVAFNGWKTGSIGIWTQDAKLRYYKNLFYLNNSEGLSFSFSVMSVPPFEELKKAESAVPWRIQAFDKSWAQAAARYREWRDENVRMVPRPDFTKQISFMGSISGPQQQHLDAYLRYVQPWQSRTAAFQTSVRAAPFDHNHADNTPYEGFKQDVPKWREAGTFGMSYMQPMIMWGPFPKDLPAREKEGIALHREADTRSVFQKDPNTVVEYVDQHHLGHPGWQRWFLDWVKEWSQDYGAQGIYHDQSYPTPIDRRGLAIGGMTSPEGMADYFYKAATENPGTFHGTEMVNEANATVVANAIGSGYHWGTAPYMRLARAYGTSPVTAALAYPDTVLWSFVRLRGDSLWDLRERRMQESRGQIAGAIDGPYNWTFKPQWWPAMANTAWHDRTRDVAFMENGLRPYFPAEYSRDVLSYYRGVKGEEFRYERTPWGSRFVEVAKDGKVTPIYGAATGVQAVADADFGIANWLVYNDDDPSHTWKRTGPAGLHPARWYVLDPGIKRPKVWFSTEQGYGPSFYESYVEDGASNEYFAFLRLRPIDDLVPVGGSEVITLHSPQSPRAVYIDGKKIEFKPKADAPGQYSFSAPTPSDILVFLKEPPAALADIHQAALLRSTESATPVDYYHPDKISDQANGGVDAEGRPILQDVAVSSLGFQYGGRKHLYVPVTAPADGKEHTLRLHLHLLEEHGKKWNHLVDLVEVNLQPKAVKEGEMTVPETIDVIFAPGETKLIGFRTRALSHQYWAQMDRVTTKMSIEWIKAEQP